MSLNSELLKKLDWSHFCHGRDPSHDLFLYLVLDPGLCPYLGLYLALCPDHDLYFDHRRSLC